MPSTGVPPDWSPL